ncbi:hypothetical protein [Geoglobus acetivorans]|uniref:Chromosome segregation ATPase n=1 Tax=Geoglobus acetivorans TaxID=565033 RepID=A0A0A7GCV9_GEOAI|nr:hypothetical protein GACE_0646 [Geoglobus acetivorans]
MRWYIAIGAVLIVALMPAFVMAHGMMEDDDEHPYANDSMNSTMNETYGMGMGMGPAMGTGHDDDDHDDDLTEKRHEMRERWKERMEEIKEYRERMKERMEHVREVKEEHRMKYMEEKERYERMKHRGLEDPEVFNTAKGFVVNGVGFAIAHLDELENRVIAMNLSDNATAELLGDIEAIKETLYGWELVFNNSTTPQEFRDNVLAFREEWSLQRVKINAVTSKVVALKFLEVIEKAENRTWIIEDKITKLEEIGADTTEIEEAYLEYLEALSEAKDSITLALQHFDNAINSDNYEMAIEELKEGKELYHEAIEEFRDSMMELRDVFKEYAENIRELRQNSTALNESS